MVGRTAKSYAPPAGRIVTARVAAICVRRLQDVNAEWQSSIAVAEWEVVLPELVVELES
jgi:ATP-dependent DNA helicase RecQ